MSNVWAEADALKNKAVQSFNWLRLSVYDIDKRAGNSVKVLEDGTGRFRLRFDAVEFTSRDHKDLFEQFKAAHERVKAREAKK